jgi:glycosyltransferase involved in cell wall biosynthesis
MTRVLMFIGHYLPARHAGGPLRSTASMVEGLPECEFHVFTSETDFKSDEMLEGIAVNRWQWRGRALVFYASARRRRWFVLPRVVRGAAPDLIYLHGYFARRFTMPVLVLRRLGFLPRLPVILAPRGEFSPGALQLKSRRKQFYLNLARRLGLYRNVVWHACSAVEVEDIRQVHGPRVQIVEAANFPAVPSPDAPAMHRRKGLPDCRLVFLSRISPKKNLLGAIETLVRVCESVVFDVYGPIEDVAYWVRCEAAARDLPANVRMQYRGEVAPDGAEKVFAGYDALFLPTLGENYGHVIVEAWAAATPVLISDRTPWTELEADRVGWSAPPDDYATFAERIEALAQMDEAEHEHWRAGAFARAEALACDDSLQAAYARLFTTALEQGRGR